MKVVEGDDLGLGIVALEHQGEGRTDEPRTARNEDP
jgi:hypothetical protein